jgi:hypothetical protein
MVQVLSTSKNRTIADFTDYADLELREEVE